MQKSKIFVDSASKAEFGLNKEGMDGWEIAESSIGQSLGAFSLILKREI